MIKNIYPQKPGEVFVVDTSYTDTVFPDKRGYITLDKVTAPNGPSEFVYLKNKTTLLYVETRKFGNPEYDSDETCHVFLTSDNIEVKIGRGCSRDFHPNTGWLKKLDV